MWRSFCCCCCCLRFCCCWVCVVVWWSFALQLNNYCVYSAEQTGSADNQVRRGKTWEDCFRIFSCQTNSNLKKKGGYIFPKKRTRHFLVIICDNNINHHNAFDQCPLLEMCRQTFGPGGATMASKYTEESRTWKDTNYIYHGLPKKKYFVTN